MGKPISRNFLINDFHLIFSQIPSRIFTIFFIKTDWLKFLEIRTLSSGIRKTMKKMWWTAQNNCFLIIFISINTTKITAKNLNVVFERNRKLRCCFWIKISFRSSQHILTNSQSRIFANVLNQSEWDFFPHLLFFKLFLFQWIQPKLQPKN